jgi:8-oxo-dGTP diphosphatase
MPHIHTEPGQHDITTTAFIIRTDTDEPRGLVHMHRKLHLLLPVGGHVELHENPWSASIHEIKEESGYEITQLRVLQPIERIQKMDGVKTHPVPLFLQTHAFKDSADHYHIDVGFLFVTAEDPLSTPAEGEAKELLWLTNNEVLARSNEMPADIAQIYNFAFSVALKKWERVSPNVFDA